MQREDQPIIRGRCLCGACVFELVGRANWVGHCHCDSCRRATASAFTTWIGQENGFWRLVGEEPATYQSSPGNLRGFCRTCGSPIFYQSQRYANEMHFYAALLDNADGIEPQAHFHADEKLSWVHMSDGLPDA
jgi:hypothetical protein